MAIDIKNNKVVGAKAFVIAPSDAPIVAEGNELHNVETVFDIREAPSLLKKIGLSADVPITDVIKLLMAIRETPDNAEQIARNGLSKYLGAAANWAAIASLLLQITQTVKF